MLSGKKLQFIRIYKGISQIDVAKKLNVSKSYISMLENEKQEIPENFYTKWIDVLNGKDIEKSIEGEAENIENEVIENVKEIKSAKKKKTKS